MLRGLAGESTLWTTTSSGARRCGALSRTTPPSPRRPSTCTNFHTSSEGVIGQHPQLRDRISSGIVMPMLLQAARDFLMLLVTIDPVGTVALFVPLTAGLPAAERSRIARKGVLVAGCVLVAFLVAGELLLSELGIRLVSFQVAGGVILFLFGLQMVFGTGVMAERAFTEEPGHDVAVFPLALPGIANPGAIMAVVLLTDNHRHSVKQQAITAVVLVIVLLLTLFALLASKHLSRLLGGTGMNVLIRVMGLLLAALATEQIATGLEGILKAHAG
jgi:multiple antibiotic resistance protein